MPKPLLPLACLLAAVLALPAAALAQAKQRVTAQLLAVNDFHGNLEPPRRPARIPDRARRHRRSRPAASRTSRTRPRRSAPAAADTLTVSAGDLIGASPLLSALFHDEPTIEALNEIGLDVSAVGNHEFDEGPDELLRMQRGGCHPDGRRQDGDARSPAPDFATSRRTSSHGDGQAVLPAYRSRRSAASIGFVGLTLEGTPSVVSPSGVAGLRSATRPTTVNALRARLRRTGVDAIVVLLHQGGFQRPPASIRRCNGSAAGGRHRQAADRGGRRGHLRPHAPGPTTAAWSASG